VARTYHVSIRRALAAVALAPAMMAIIPSSDGRAQAGEPPPSEEQVRYSGKRSFKVGYGEQKGVGRARLWVSESGGAEWRPHGYYAPGQSVVQVDTERDSSYGFYVVLEDLAGNKSPEPEPGTSPQVTIVVDTKPPHLEILSPRVGFYGPARGAEIKWRLSDEYAADDCVSIEMSPDGGKSWSVLAKSRPAVGSYTWTPPDPKKLDADKNDLDKPDPNKNERPGPVRFLLSGRDLAGNEARVESKELVYDDRPPLVHASGEPSTAGAEVTVAYAAKEDEGARIESVRAYVSTDGGATWSEAAADTDGVSPLLWRAGQSGKYGMLLAGTDRAGNAAPAPAPGADPQLTFEVRVGPKVKLFTFDTVGFYKGGSSEPVRWEVKGEGLGERCVTLEYSLDDGETWKLVAKDQPPSCEFSWTLPRADTEKALVRVTARNEAGEVGRAVSGRQFTIDSTPPRAVVRFDTSAEEAPAPLAVEKPPPMNIPELPEPGRAEPEAITRAREHLAARRYDQAIEALGSFLRRAPGSVRANILLGQALARWTDRLAREGRLEPEEILRRYGRAAAAFETAVRAADGSGEAHFWLGICHYQRARTLYERLRRARAASEWAARAADEYELTLAIKPNSPDEYCYAGMAYFLQAFSGPAKGRDLLVERARGLFAKSLGGITPGSLSKTTPRGTALRATAGRARWHLADLAARRSEDSEALKHARAALELLGEGSDLAPNLRALIARLAGK